MPSKEHAIETVTERRLIIRKSLSDAHDRRDREFEAARLPGALHSYVIIEEKFGLFIQSQCPSQSQHHIHLKRFWYHALGS